MGVPEGRAGLIERVMISRLSPSRDQSPPPLHTLIIVICVYLLECYTQIRLLYALTFGSFVFVELHTRTLALMTRISVVL